MQFTSKYFIIIRVTTCCYGDETLEPKVAEVATCTLSVLLLIYQSGLNVSIEIRCNLVVFVPLLCYNHCHTTLQKYCSRSNYVIDPLPSLTVSQ